MAQEYSFDAILHEIPENGGAYVVFPRDSSIVNMGLKDPQGNIRYTIGVLKSIRRQLGKAEGDSIHVTLSER